jgi:hypothetical protein
MIRPASVGSATATLAERLAAPPAKDRGGAIVTRLVSGRQPEQV